MPEMSSFMYCEQVMVNQSDNKMRIEGPVNLMNPLFIPSMYSFAIVLGIVGVDTTVNNTLNIKFLNSNEEVVIDTNLLPIEKESNTEKNDLPFEMRGIQINMDFRNVALRVEGIYKTVIAFNNEVIGVYPIPVKAVENNG